MCLSILRSLVSVVLNDRSARRDLIITSQYCGPFREIGHPIHFLQCHLEIAIKSKLCHALNCYKCSAWPSSSCLCSYQSCEFFQDFYLLLASVRAAFPCPVVSPSWILVHEHPCFRNSTFSHTAETHLFNTLSLVIVSDDLLGN